MIAVRQSSNRSRLPQRKQCDMTREKSCIWKFWNLRTGRGVLCLEGSPRGADFGRRENADKMMRYVVKLRRARLPWPRNPCALLETCLMRSREVWALSPANPDGATWQRRLFFFVYTAACSACACLPLVASDGFFGQAVRIHRRVRIA